MLVHRNISEDFQRDENANQQTEPWSVEQHMKLLQSGPAQDDVFDGKTLELPTWFDLQKFRRGQKFFNDNYFAIFVSNLSGLLAILTVPEISNILVMTNQSSEPKTAFKRYLSTIAHMLLWYGGDITNEASWAFKSMREVHQRHTAASNRGRKEGRGRVLQSSLAITQFGFMGYGLLTPHKLGIKCDSPQDLEGFIHFWRTIGYMLGLQDRYNICRDSVEETRALCQAIMQHFFVPELQKPSEQFSHLSTALLSGMWAVTPQINVESSTAFLKHLSGLPHESCSNWYSRFMFSFQVFVHETLLGSKWFGSMWRRFFNFHMWFTVVINMKFPLLAYFTFGTPLKPLNLFKS